jgi:cell division protein FtsI (penicillin-binding protein 3)
MALTERGIQFRIRIFGTLFVLVFLLIAARAWYLQVVIAPDLQGRAEQQRQRIVKLAPQRGSILDRHGAPLALSLDTQSLYADPLRVKNPEQVAATLAGILELPKSKLVKQLSGKKRFVKPFDGIL